jgi:hypothetical protein
MDDSFWIAISAIFTAVSSGIALSMVILNYSTFRNQNKIFSIQIREDQERRRQNLQSHYNEVKFQLEGLLSYNERVSYGITSLSISVHDEYPWTQLVMSYSLCLLLKNNRYADIHIYHDKYDINPLNIKIIEQIEIINKKIDKYKEDIIVYIKKKFSQFHLIEYDQPVILTFLYKF